jgi:hypothetical protein
VVAAAPPLAPTVLFAPDAGLQLAAVAEEKHPPHPPPAV